ncbi:RluA family pseudouridine synthase [Bacillus sp. 03113]|uniref:RluA family pseudouridine synthase n=1 Tax=Bacillus sp. 03113 TaxID=2578211 RepID=UPI001141EF9F|nr:RluA family pseudouridine synthase [Bacillus sp. 03113]
MSKFKLEWIIDRSDEGKMIKDFLKEKEISNTALTEIKYKGGKIAVNRHEVNVRHKLANDDRLLVEFPLEQPSIGIEAEKLPLTILYEDEYILVVNKDAGISTIPSREHPRGSLANALLGYYQELGLEATVHIVTRLDRDTSGVVLVAKHKHIHHLLSSQQQAGSVKRTYEAFVEGLIQADSGTIEMPIGRKSSSIIEREVRPDGKFARTHFKVIKLKTQFSHLLLELDTGRTHQIRVHLSYLGYPLIGDDLYGGSLHYINRQALHCKKISFNHPFTKHKMTFESDLPEDMKGLLQNDKKKHFEI